MCLSRLTYHDTLLIARKKYPNQKNDLSSLCARLGIKTEERDSTGLHSALADARLTAQAFLAINKEAVQLSMNLTSRQEEEGSVAADGGEASVPVALTEEIVAAHERFRAQLRKEYGCDALLLDKSMPIDEMRGYVGGLGLSKDKAKDDINGN